MSALLPNECEKIQAYAEMLAEGVSGRATLEDIDCKTVPELKRMLTKRLFQTTGNKASLIERLLNKEANNEAIVQEYFRRAHLTVIRCIHTYGETGFGNNPPHMCRVEYWLAHGRRSVSQTDAVLVTSRANKALDAGR
jgi:hypothetical protein